MDFQSKSDGRVHRKSGADGVPSGRDFWHRPLAASRLADVVELVDTQDLKS
jgi:hypothetical protein